jgi:transcriptional regulator with XRE-family HTH domain
MTQSKAAVRLRSTRARRHLSLRKAASLLGRPPSVLSRLEAGITKNVSVELAEAIRREFGIPVMDWLREA